MMNGYTSVPEAAVIWRIPPRQAQAPCAVNHIDAAARMSASGQFPETNPADEQYKKGSVQQWLMRKESRKSEQEKSYQYFY